MTAHDLALVRPRPGHVVLDSGIHEALKAIKRAQAKLKQARLSNDLEAVQSASGEIAKQALRASVLSDELARLTSVHRRRSRLTGVRS